MWFTNGTFCSTIDKLVELHQQILEEEKCSTSYSEVST